MSSLHQQAEMLSNRVRKNARHRRKWARRTGVSCYRLYDRDIPEVPLAIDWYDGRLYVAEFVRGEDTDGLHSVVESWVTAVADALSVPPDRTFIKRRRRQRGAQQYERMDDVGQRFVVGEGGLKFYVNLSDYLDTGLFLDHRVTRDLVRRGADGCRLLNLFAYTGAFSVYGADGGADTTTVDLSATYLRWAADNMKLNRFEGPNHRFVRADAVTWCREAAERGERFDLIVLDPPTFSNSKRTDTVLDIRRDQIQLLRTVMSVLHRDGVLWFSTNARRFSIDDEVREFAKVEDMTHQTVPADFTRRPHRCWKLGHLL